MDFQKIADLAQLAIRTAAMKLPTDRIAEYIEGAVGMTQQRNTYEAMLSGRILPMRQIENGEFRQFRVILEEVKS